MVSAVTGRLAGQAKEVADVGWSSVREQPRGNRWMPKENLMAGEPSEDGYIQDTTAKARGRRRIWTIRS